MRRASRSVVGGSAVSTFYLLPPRAYLGQRLATSLGPIFPFLELTSPAWAALADAVGQAAAAQPDVFVVYRDELPHGEDATRALADGYGAETGDMIVEVNCGAAGELTARRWRLGRAA